MKLIPFAALIVVSSLLASCQGLTLATNPDGGVSASYTPPVTPAK